MSTSALGTVLGAYARITASGSVTSTITFTLPGFGSATVGATGTYRSFSGAVSRNVSTGRTTGIALVNARDVPIRVELILLDANGSVVAAGRLVELEARGHAARAVEEFFPEVSSTFEGTLLAVARRGFFSIRALGGLMIRLAPGEFAEAPLTGIP